MTVIRSFLAGALALALPSVVSAVPIAFGDGLLDGVLRTYRYMESPSDPSRLETVLLRDYVLGTDFMPAVPLSYLNNGVPYERCVQAGINRAAFVSLPECMSFFFPVTTQPFGEGDLRDGCSFIASVTEAPPGRPIMVERGGCSFTDKWAFAESQGWGGVMVVNDTPGGPAGATGIVPVPNEPTIAFMRLTQEVGAQIRSDDAGAGLLLEMTVRWTPNVVPVPEPSTLALMIAGLAAACWRRRGRETERK